jgi:hypothetical protein
MRTAITVAVLLFTSLSLCAQAPQSPPATERHAVTSSIEFKTLRGKQHTITRNQKFSTFYACLDECTDIVLHETYYRDEEEGVEGGIYEVRAKAWSKQKPDRVLWTINSGGE